MSHPISHKQSIQSPLKHLPLDQQVDLQHYIEIGRLSATLIHEMSGPLTAALLQLDQINGSDQKQIREVKRSLSMLKSYIQAARQQLERHSRQPSSFCIFPQIDQLKRLVIPLARAQHVQLEFSNTPHYRLRGDPVKFQQVMANLILNAIDAYSDTPEDGLLRPVRVVIRGTQDAVEITVIDWGKGIAAPSLPRLFEPFYTTKTGTSHGLGIGLTIVKEHVTECFHGAIRVSSSARLGTRFIIALPALPYSPAHLRKKVIPGK
jgi:two-component system C4-dicarboxylate transport sensor histidine kinase DctB